MTGRGFRLGLGGLAALLLLACAAGPTETAPRFAPEPPPADEDAARRMGRPAPSQPDRVVGRNARISEIAAMVEGERVRFTLRGTLPDGCTTVRGVRATRADRRITLVVWTERPREAMCTMALTPFSRSVSLKTEGLSPGDYTVRVGSEETTFSLPPDAPLRLNSTPSSSEHRGGARHRHSGNRGDCFRWRGRHERIRFVWIPMA